MIDTAAIRNKLIHLAVSGNLVEHDIEDGNASELVEKLSYEINGSSRREIAIDEIPYEIPDNWTWCRLSDIGSTNIGLTYHPEDVDIDGTPVLRSNNIKNNKLIFEDLIKVNCEIREKQYISKNDILICARNGSKALVGKCAIYNGELGLTSFGAFMAVYRTLCFEYVYYYFQTKVFRRYFENENNKQINQVTQSILKDAIIPLPPINEQKRIIDKISKAFEQLDIIDDLQLQYASDLEVLKSKIIDAGIQGKLTEQLPEDGTAEELLKQIAEEKKQLIKEKKIKATKALPEITEDEIPFEIPDTWKWVRLSEIMDVRDGTHDSPKYVEEGIPLVTSKNISSGGLDFSNVNYITQDDADKINERSNVDTGDILFAMIGTIGNPVIVEKDRNFCIKNVALFKNFAKERIDIRYIYWMLMREQYVMKKKAIGGLQPFISLKVFREYPIPLPPISEQKRISARLDEIISMC